MKTRIRHTALLLCVLMLLSLLPRPAMAEGEVVLGESLEEGIVLSLETDESEDGELAIGASSEGETPSGAEVGDDKAASEESGAIFSQEEDPDSLKDEGNSEDDTQEKREAEESSEKAEPETGEEDSADPKDLDDPDAEKKDNEEADSESSLPAILILSRDFIPGGENDEELLDAYAQQQLSAAPQAHGAPGRRQRDEGHERGSGLCLLYPEKLGRPDGERRAGVDDLYGELRCLRRHLDPGGSGL